MPETPREMPESVSHEIAKEKSIMHSSLVNVHRWWARRPSITARLATYLSLADRDASDDAILRDLGKVTPQPSIVDSARTNIRDAQWKWIWQQRTRQMTGQPIESPTVPESPKILDPFAGGGSIPLEAARLGCDTYASDLNPLSYHILCATLTYPQLFAERDGKVAGTSPEKTWNGLASEIRHWAKRWMENTERLIATLYPPISSNDAATPTHYFWLIPIQCHNPACAENYPLRSDQTLSRQQRLQLTIQPHPSSRGFSGTIVNLTQDPAGSRDSVCPYCGTTTKDETGKGVHRSAGTPVLVALVATENGVRRFRGVTPNETEKHAPWGEGQRSRMTELLSQEYAALLSTELSGDCYAALRLWGDNTFADLFLRRQLLVTLEYGQTLRTIRHEMETLDIPKAQHKALITYLSFFLGWLVDHNSKLCRWDSQRETATPSFTRGTPSFPGIVVESSPTGMVDRWLASLLPTIDALATLPSAVSVSQVDAAALPYPADFFDAVVTDPPHFDNVPYNELANFFWVWEAPQILKEVNRPWSAESVGVETRVDAIAAYRDELSRAFNESFRVLKPGRSFVMLFFAKTRKSFDEYVSIAQEAGFELAQVRRIREEWSQDVNTSALAFTILICFTKPIEDNPRRRLLVDDPPSVLAAALEDRPVLYEGMAQMLQETVEEDQLIAMLPTNASGSTLEKLMEKLAEVDVGEFLTEQLGLHGIRRLVKERGWSNKVDAQRTHVDVLLGEFGFSFSSPTSEKGIHDVCELIRLSVPRVRTLSDKAMLRGVCLEVFTAIERALKLTVWGWAAVAYGQDRDEQLLDILRANHPARTWHLDRLTFGDLVALFRALPDAIAASDSLPVLEQKLGRRHVYLPKNKKTRFSDRFDRIVAFRNKVEHNKENYWDESPLERLVDDAIEVLENGRVLLMDLATECATPFIARVTHEIKDELNRLSYRLLLDDGTDVEIVSSSRMSLGSAMLYFKGATNPRPVDPLVVCLEELGTWCGSS